MADPLSKAVLASSIVTRLTSFSERGISLDGGFGRTSNGIGVGTNPLQANIERRIMEIASMGFVLDIDTL